MQIKGGGGKVRMQDLQPNLREDRYSLRTGGGQEQDWELDKRQRKTEMRRNEIKDQNP